MCIKVVSTFESKYTLQELAFTPQSMLMLLKKRDTVRFPYLEDRSPLGTPSESFTVPKAAYHNITVPLTFYREYIWTGYKCQRRFRPSLPLCQGYFSSSQLSWVYHSIIGWFVLRWVFVSMLYSSCYYCDVDLSTFYLGFPVFHFLVNSIIEQRLDSPYEKGVIDDGREPWSARRGEFSVTGREKHIFKGEEKERHVYVKWIKIPTRNKWHCEF